MGVFGKSGIDFSSEALIVCRIRCETEIQFYDPSSSRPIDPVKRVMKDPFIISNIFVAF
jgi:hypothetical protein